MKKILTITLTILLLASVAGCNNSNENKLSTSNSLEDLQAEFNQIEKELNSLDENDEKRRELMQRMVDNLAEQAKYMNNDGESVSHSVSDTSQSPQTNSTAAYTLTAGDYEIPVDVVEGKYDVVCTSGNGVFNVYDPENGYIISETMNITKEYGITERKNATLKSGQAINITGTLTIDLISK